MGPLQPMHTSQTSHTSLSPFEHLAQPADEPATGMVTPPTSQQHAAMEMHGGLPGEGGGAPPSLPDSPLLEPRMLPRDGGPPPNPPLNHPHKQVSFWWTFHKVVEQ